MEDKQPEKKGAIIVSTETWKEFGLKDRALFDRICDRYKFKPDGMRENLQKLQHRPATRTLRTTGEKQSCLELRTKGRDGSHAVVNGSDGIWYCVKPDTIILGDNCAIKDAKGHAIDGAGKLSQIKASVVRMYSGDMVKIKANGMLPVETTPEHRIFVASRKKTCSHCEKKKGNTSGWKVAAPAWKAASELSRKDCLIIPILKPAKVQTRFLLESDSQTWNRRGRISFSLSAQVGEILGWYLAEGSSDKAGTITLDLASHQVTAIERLQYLIFENFGRKAHLVRQGNCTRVRFRALHLSRWLKTNFGGSAAEKKIPDFLMFLNKDDVLSGFLKAYFWGDGNRRPGLYEHVVFNTVSKVLALQLQLLLARLGAWSNISEVPARNGTINGVPFTGSIAYRITSSARKTSEIVGIPYEKRQKEYVRVKMTKDFVYVPIRSVEQNKYEGEVWDISTQRHSFLASNAVIHNCMCPRYLFNGGMRSLVPCKHIVYCIVNGLGKPEDWMQYLI